MTRSALYLMAAAASAGLISLSSSSASPWLSRIESSLIEEVGLNSFLPSLSSLIEEVLHGP